MNTVISIEHLTKQYDLGVIGTGTISRDLNRWWARVRKQPDPYTRIGHRDAFERIGETILALNDISFTVPQGEALGIIGRNGAGKSTLLKILSRVTAPTSGVVKVKGRIGSLLEVGTGFHPELTGRENVYLNGAILGMKKAEVARKFDEIVEFSGVEKFINTPVKRYSSGMYVRLAFAVAAHLDPEILIVDEVLAVGDAEFQKKCLGKMSDVAGEGRTVLFVSHNMGAVKSLCKYGILLSSGSIIYQGTVENTVQTYLEKTVVLDQKNLNYYKKMKGGEIIKKVEVNDSPEFSLPKINIGDNLKIRLYLNNTHFLNKFHISIGFNNEIGERIFTISTRNQNSEVRFSDKDVIVDCLIKELNIAPGLYFLKVCIGDMFQDFDVVEGYPGYEVNPSDYLGTGRLPYRNQGILIKKADFIEVNL